jgi:geranylgeranyl diphosphate synthase type I
MIAKYHEYRQAVEAELRDVFDGREGFLYNLLRYHLGWVDQHGRREEGDTPLHIQGAAALVCCEALGADFHAALPAAAGVELVHHFTLVHGEVQAGRAESVDRPGIWWVWGPAQAINAGDGLHALGRSAMMRSGKRGMPPERVLRAVRSLDQACLLLCEGQYMDLEFQDQLMVTANAYLDMVNRKSGALTGCAAESGALAAGAEGDRCDALHSLGVKLGAALQIARDTADFWGERGDALTASNIIAKKKSLPIIHALEHGSLAAKRELGSIYMKRVMEPQDATRLVAILEETGARDATENRARQLADDALDSASEAGVSPDGLELLRELSQWALEGSR